MDLVVVLLMAAVIYLWWWARECRCENCAYHVNERRMAALKAKEELTIERERQARARHEVDHKGWGWALGEPDTMNCKDPSCPRNKPRGGKLDA